MTQPGSSRQQEFADICTKNNFVLNDFSSSWVTFSEFLGYLPTLRNQSYDALLSSRAVQEMSDGHSRYYFEISDVLRPGDPEPLERSEAIVRRILYNQRQNEIIRAYDEEVYRKAVGGGRVKIHERRKIETDEQEDSVLRSLVLAIFAGAAQKRQVMLDRVVAVVGGSSILWSEVDEYAGELVEQRRQQGYTSDRDPHDEALEQLLMQKLLFNQALIDSVDVSYSGIAQRVEAHLQALIDDAGSIAALETKQHMPIFNVREMLRQRYEEQAYAQAMQSSVVGKSR